MEVVAICISGLSLAVAAGAFVRNELRWRAERKRDVRVLVRHDGMGLDIYGAETIEVEHVIALSVLNHGEKDEHVMWTGLDSPTGEPLADDRPKAVKIVNDPLPEARVLAPRGQIAVQFKLPEAAIKDGFIGYAVLGTGERVYSAPGTPDVGIGELQSEVREVIAEADQEDDSAPPPRP